MSESYPVQGRIATLADALLRILDLSSESYPVQGRIATIDSLLKNFIV